MTNRDQDGEHHARGKSFSRRERRGARARGLGSGINAYFNVSMYCIGVFVCCCCCCCFLLCVCKLEKGGIVNGGLTLGAS